MPTSEELKKQLEEQLAKEQETSEEQQIETRETEQRVIELRLKLLLRDLKDKETQTKGSFPGRKATIMEIDTERKDNTKTSNRIRNEIDELKYNIELCEESLPKERVDEIKKMIEGEK